MCVSTTRSTAETWQLCVCVHVCARTCVCQGNSTDTARLFIAETETCVFADACWLICTGGENLALPVRCLVPPRTHVERERDNPDRLWQHEMIISPFVMSRMVSTIQQR